MRTTPHTPLSITRRRATGALLATLLAAHGGSAQAHEYFAGTFTLVHPWAEATEPQAKDAPVYFVLENVTRADKLLRAYTTVAEQVELRPGADTQAPALASMDIPVQEKLEFNPGKAHVLLKGLKVPLQWGRSYAMTFVFEQAGPVSVMVSIGAH